VLRAVRTPGLRRFHAHSAQQLRPPAAHGLHGVRRRQPPAVHGLRCGVQQLQPPAVRGLHGVRRRRPPAVHGLRGVNRTEPLFMVSAVYSDTKIHQTSNLCTQLIVVNLQDEDVLWVKALGPCSLPSSRVAGRTTSTDTILLLLPQKQKHCHSLRPLTVEYCAPPSPAQQHTHWSHRDISVALALR